jgi:hypothetical protein
MAGLTPSNEFHRAVPETPDALSRVHTFLVRTNVVAEHMLPAPVGSHAEERRTRARTDGSGANAARQYWGNDA